MPGHTYTAPLVTPAPTRASSTRSEAVESRSVTGGTTSGGLLESKVSLNETAAANIAAAAVNRQPNPPDYSDFILVEGLQYALEGVGKQNRNRFIDEFKPNFQVVSEANVNQGLFLITRRKHYGGIFEDLDNGNVEIQQYTGLEDYPITVKNETTDGDIKIDTIKYSTEESSVFFDTYGYVILQGGILPQELELQVSITSEPGRNEGNLQNSTAEPELISYDALSSLGSINQENVTISSTTEETARAIRFGTGQITDIGGAVAQGTVTRTAFDSFGNETTSTATIVSGGGY